MSVIRQQTNLKRRKHRVSHGHRWMPETVFLSIKKMFGKMYQVGNFKHDKGDVPESIIV
jgi:hypothetical protein